MKKLFNYALLAAALLVGVNVNAENVARVAIEGGDTNDFATLYEAFTSIKAGETATITMLQNAQLYTKKADNYILTLDGDRDITLDMAGKNFVANHARINIDGAKLHIIGEGTFQYKGHYESDGYPDEEDEEGNKFPDQFQFITLYGTSDPGEPYGYSLLEVGKDIRFVAYGYATAINTNNKPYSYGVQMDVYGYFSGTFGACSISGNVQAKTGNVPVINIFKDATFTSDDAGIYAAGYAIWNIYGRVEGPTGIYIKGGEINVIGGTVVATGEASDPVSTGSGFQGTGDAIVIDSHSGYTEGGMSLNISGDANISSAHGYGIHEVVTSGEDRCEDITITSGNISGAEDKSSIAVTDFGADNTTITGGSFNSDIAYLLSGDNDIITPIDDGKGGTIYVISEKPSEAGDWKEEIGNNDKDFVKLVTTTTQELTNGGKAAYLVQEGTATVIIPAGKTLEVGEIVLDKDAQIIVEKGAKLIVKGDKGIVAKQATNIVLKSEENAPAFFLLDPQVQSNKTPKATVKFTSNSWYQDAQHYQYQYFGAPFVGGALESVKPLGGFAKRTVFYVWNKTSWVEGGYIEDDTDNLKYEAFQNPFGFYAMVANTPQGTPVTYEFDGRLYGNTNPEVHVIKGYVPLSNGFSANMDGDLLIEQLGSTTINKAAWAPISNADGTLQWKAYTELRALGEVAPMGTFMVQNGGSGTDLVLDYESLVWDNKSGAKAPKVNNFAMATVRVDGCGLNDIITIAEDNMFSADYDNGYDAEKYENTNIRFYVNAEKEYDIFATDNLDNTFVGLMTTKAGKYTISFEGVTGEFALVDLATNARIEMNEGTTYEFLAEAGEDAYRFMIVEAAKAPTNTPATKAAVKATKALINDQIVISNGERFFNMLGTDVK